MQISELYRLFLQHPVITTDSRNCPEGSIFFALKGESFNGNEFAKTALEQGCSYAVVDEAAWCLPDDNRFIVVDNCLQTLKLLANRHRRALGTPIIGITGTNGKTTTKELLAAVLTQRYNVLYTQGNFNNDIGVPKTLLQLKPEHEVAVIEMGASHPGDIKSLVDVVEPDHALITNVGRAHLQGFGSFEGVKQTKAELYDYMQAHKPQGAVFINQDNEHLLQMFQEHCPDANLIGYAQTPLPGISFRGEVVDSGPYLKFRWCRTNSTAPLSDNTQWHDVQTHLIGAYNLDNMLAAISIGTHFGVTAQQIDHALANYIPGNNRSQLEVTAHNRLIVDAYNANPTSMEAALTNFEQMKVNKKMAILGDMRELGAVSVAEHQKIVDLIATLHLDKVWLVGEEFGKTNTSQFVFKDTEAVRQAILNEQPKGYHILIKGSNGMHLAQLTEIL